jgi:Fe-S-cluster containining protein
MEEVRTLYEKIDAAYETAADSYGFECNGCADNCCMTYFFHYTHLEYLYLRKGFFTLDDTLQKQIRENAAEFNRLATEAEKTGTRPGNWCPANFEGKCSLYEYRPMICRLHGIPHELNRPGYETIYCPGCEEFEKIFGKDIYRRFDRTPFYSEMARLEKQLKQSANIDNKFKMTIAHMITTF